MAGDDEADHVAPAAVPAHTDVLHGGVGQEAALHLDSTSWHNNLLLATLSLVHHLAQTEVLAALKLDQVLLAVDDLQGPVALLSGLIFTLDSLLMYTLSKLV